MHHLATNALRHRQPDRRHYDDTGWSHCAQSDWLKIVLWYMADNQSE